jgi:vacuolar-type H+-ATPase subunit H
LQAKAARDQARKLREDQIATVLSDYYLAAGHAQRLRDQARQKAEAVLADGEEAARMLDASAARAVRVLRTLLGGVPEVAELCDLTQAAVRSLLATPKAADAGTTSSAPDASSPPPGTREPGGWGSE